MNPDKSYTVEGFMRKGTKSLFFRQTLSAPNEKMALERAYALIGSRHRAKRTEIRFRKIEETKEP
jgi:ribosomal protein L20A (L18A)